MPLNITNEIATLNRMRVGQLKEKYAKVFGETARNGDVANQAELARLGHVSRARLTQIMNLLNLAPNIQENILHLRRVEHGRDSVTERDLWPISAIADWRKQRRMWAVLGRE